MGPEGRVAATEGWRSAAERGGLAWVAAWSATALTTSDPPRRLVFLSTDRLFEYHAKLANRMAAHLQLTCETIDSFAWLSAGMLSTNAATAQASANAYHEHLVRCASKTGYDAVFVAEPGLFDQLAAFSAARPPDLLWRGRGAYQDLFRFLALRFLANPDSVLKCESVHAQWKWIEQNARGIKVPSPQRHAEVAKLPQAEQQLVPACWRSRFLSLREVVEERNVRSAHLRAASNLPRNCQQVLFYEFPTRSGRAPT